LDISLIVVHTNCNGAVQHQMSKQR